MENFTKHHIVPQSRDGVTSERNIVMLPEHVHVNLHRIFSNKTPTEQIEWLMNINSTALQDRFKRRVAELIYAEP